MKNIDFLVKAIYKGREYRRMARYKYEDIAIVQECLNEKINIKFRNGETETLTAMKYQFVAKNELNSILYSPELLNIPEEKVRNIVGISHDFKFEENNMVYVIADEETLSVLNSSLKYL